MGIVKTDQKHLAIDLDLSNVRGPAAPDASLPSLDRNRVEINKNLHQQAYKETLAVLRSLEKGGAQSGPQKEAVRQLRRQLPKISKGLRDAQAAVEGMNTNPQFVANPEEFLEANKMLREVQKLTSKARKLV